MHTNNQIVCFMLKIVEIFKCQFVFLLLIRSNQPTEEPSGMLMMSITLPSGAKSVPRQLFYERWVQCFLLTQEKEVGLFELSVLPSNTRDDSSLAKVIYRITDQSFIVQEIEYSSQSDRGSST